MNERIPYRAVESSPTLIIRATRHGIIACGLMLGTFLVCAALSCPGDGAMNEGLRAVANDADGDGIDDAWEAANGLDPNSNDSGIDADGDGLPNGDEYLLGSDPLLPSSRLRAFPTAEGFGSHAFGGRGRTTPVAKIIAETTGAAARNVNSIAGRQFDATETQLGTGAAHADIAPTVHFVTTLMDRVTDPGTGQKVPAPGSLRAALEASGPRFVVFKVSGTIFLEAPIYIQNPYVTVAGQTAPGQGVCIGHNMISIRAHDVVLRHLRLRMYFDTDLDWRNASNMDGINLARQDYDVADPLLDSVHNVVIDHCSITWAPDENISPSAWVRAFTIQWCIIGEGARYGGESGFGGYGWLAEFGIAGSTSPERLCRTSLHHNLFIHNAGRNPTVSGGELYDIRNNVVYNWNNGFPSQFRKSPNVNFVGNCYIAGIDTNAIPVLRNILDVTDPVTTSAHPKFYIDNNLAPRRTSNDQDQWDVGVAYFRREDGTVCGQAIGSSCIRYVVDTGEDGLFRLNEPVPAPPITQHDPATARDLVLDKVGANYPQRDAVDLRLVNEVKYVRDTNPFGRTDPGYNVNTDPNLHHSGPNDGPLLNVLIFKPQNDPNFSCLPRTYRVRPGQTILQAKQEMLARMTCNFSDGLKLPGDAALVLANAAVYQWEVVQLNIPDANTLNTLYPPVPSPLLPADSDNDGIPNSWEAIIGSNPNVPDSTGDVDGDGYLNIEEYINGLVGE
jgi:hypothetical protein